MICENITPKEFCEILNISQQEEITHDLLVCKINIAELESNITIIHYSEIKTSRDYKSIISNTGNELPNWLVEKIKINSTNAFKNINNNVENFTRIKKQENKNYIDLSSIKVERKIDRKYLGLIKLEQYVIEKCYWSFRIFLK